MMKKLLLLLLVVVATAASASAASGKIYKEGDKDKLKEKEKEKEKECDKNSKTANCDNSDKVANKVAVRASRVEEYVWMLPNQDGEKMYEEDLKKGVLDLYKWYLQNESRVNNSEALKTTGKEGAFPFKVDAKTLQQYFQFVKNNFPGLSEDDLTDAVIGTTPKKQTATNRKKYAPVSTRDDMESQVTLPVNK